MGRGEHETIPVKLSKVKGRGQGNMSWCPTLHEVEPEYPASLWE